LDEEHPQGPPSCGDARSIILTAPGDRQTKSGTAPFIRVRPTTEPPPVPGPSTSRAVDPDQPSPLRLEDPHNLDDGVAPVGGQCDRGDRDQKPCHAYLNRLDLLTASYEGHLRALIEIQRVANRSIKSEERP